MRKYWMVITSPGNFAISRSRGYNVDGFKDNKQGKRIHRMEPGDRVVYYINRTHKFGAITEVSGRPYRDDKTRIWAEQDEIWPLRIPLRPEIVLDDEQLVDARKLVSRLTFVTKLSGKASWGLAFQGSLRTIPEDDFELIASEIRCAARLEVGPEGVRHMREAEAKAAIMQLDLASNSLHDRLGEMLQAIGTWMDYNAHTRHKVTPEHSVELDVAWLKGKNPHVGIEVQIGGNIVEAKAKLEQARRFNYRKVIMVIEEDQLDKLNDHMKLDELRHWLDAWSVQAVYRLYTAGQEFFSLYAKLDESRYVDRQKLELVK